MQNSNLWGNLKKWKNEKNVNGDSFIEDKMDLEKRLNLKRLKFSLKKENPTAVELNKWFLKKCCKKAQFHLVIS